MGLYEKAKAKDIIADKGTLNDVVNNTLHTMATIAGATLGPGGRGVLIERDGLPPLVTKDGYTVVKSLGVQKAEANVIVEAAKEICLNTAKQAGDGTTSAIVLADALCKHGNAFMQLNPKYNPQRLVSDLQELYDDLIVKYLKDNALKVKGQDQLTQVATISANGDAKIAAAVVDAVLKAGDDGTVLIEEAQGDVMRVESINGYIVTTGLKDIGHVGPIFINDRANQQVKMDNGIVFLYDGSMNDLQVPAMIQQAVEGTDFYGVPIIIMAHDFADVVLDRFAKTAKGGISIAPVKTPSSGLPNSRSMFLQDMAAYTGGTVYDPGNLDKFQEDPSFGRFTNAKVNMYESFLVCDVDASRIDARVAELKSIAEVAYSDFDKMFLRAAVGKLTGGVSTIWVGGASELEVREKKHRVEDAVEAVRSAISEGIIPGGCSVNLQLAAKIDRLNGKPSWQIMAKALRAPFELLLTNCGEDPVEVAASLQVRNSLAPDSLPSVVFDAKEHVVVDPFVAGIIEPAKVCRVSLGNALSVASLLMTLGGIVVVPRDSGLENQLELGKQAFKDMMNSGIGGE